MIRRTQSFAGTLTAAAALLLVGGGLLVGCSTGSTDAANAGGAPSAASSADAGSFPVTIEHAFGETTIDREPKRVAAIGVNDPDNLLALGVVPVGVGTVSWGGNDHGTTPWFDARLGQIGAKQPAQLDQTDDIPYDDIAALTPDLILATNSGITKAQYAKLSKIAPVVAYPGDPWTTTWQDSLEMDAKAVGREDLGEKIERRTDAALADARTEYPQLRGTTFIWASLSTADLSKVPYYTPADARPTFLRSLGMKDAPVIRRIAPEGAFYGEISAERAAQLKSDVLLTYAVKASDAKTFAADKLIGQIPAIKAGHMYASTDNVSALAAGVPTPLSIPYAVAHFVPHVAKAVAGQ